jgi:hypothetical protein
MTTQTHPHNAIRERIATLTAGIQSQVGLDSLMARYGGDLRRFYREEFPGVTPREFAYEWEARKMQIRRET